MTQSKIEQIRNIVFAEKGIDKLSDREANRLVESLNSGLFSSDSIERIVLEVLEKNKSFTCFIVDHEFPSVAKQVAERLRDDK